MRGEHLREHKLTRDKYKAFTLHLPIFPHIVLGAFLQQSLTWNIKQLNTSAVVRGGGGGRGVGLKLLMQKIEIMRTSPFAG